MADLIYEVHNHLARITLNRPKQLNCFSEEMIRLWTEALEDVRDNDDVYALLLSGNGKAFCAGGDVKAMAAGDGFFESHEDISSTALARKNSLWKGIQRIPLLLEEIDKPVVAKIHGAAVGAGLDMALMCDVRIAGESASMSESYFNAGIVPGDGGAYFLPRLVGRDKALDLFWTARTLKGKEAADMGLVTHCVPDAELDAFVEQYMEKLLAAPQQAMRLTKRAVVQGEQSSLRASLDLISSFMGPRGTAFSCGLNSPPGYFFVVFRFTASPTCLRPFGDPSASALLSALIGIRFVLGNSGKNGYRRCRYRPHSRVRAICLQNLVGGS